METQSIFSKSSNQESPTTIVALACSTGGPKSLQSVIPLLPAELKSPLVIVQHMPKGFTEALANRLNELSPIEVKEARDGETLNNGCVYIAPGGRHLRIEPLGNSHVIRLSDEAPVDALRPCANLMYQSLEKCRFRKHVCVVLTGMGADGTRGIQGLINAKKNTIVLAQDEATSVVYGMPKAVKLAGLVDEVVPLNQVAKAIITKVGI